MLSGLRYRGDAPVMRFALYACRRRSCSLHLLVSRGSVYGSASGGVATDDRSLPYSLRAEFQAQKDRQIADPQPRQE